MYWCNLSDSVFSWSYNNWFKQSLEQVPVLNYLIKYIYLLQYLSDQVL